MKVYMEGKNMQLGINSIPLKNNDFIDFTNFEVGLYFRDRCARILIRDESPLFGYQAPGAPDVSGMTTSVRNVGPRANSAL